MTPCTKLNMKLASAAPIWLLSPKDELHRIASKNIGSNDVSDINPRVRRRSGEVKNALITEAGANNSYFIVSQNVSGSLPEITAINGNKR